MIPETIRCGHCQTENIIELSTKFKLGDYVYKTKGSSWFGQVVGFYSTTLTPVGYCVESSAHKGSVQIYPESALDHWDVGTAPAK